jgi:hypothetical protein
MKTKSAALGLVAIAAALVLGPALPARAQNDTPLLAQPPELTLPPSRVRNRIEINPRPLLYRRCVDWYELQHRPSGTVLYPQMRCWWVRG